MTAHASHNSSANPHRWRALGVLLLAGFLSLLDTSIVVNGLATVQRDLGAGYAQIQLVLAGYSVAYGMLLITGGRLGDIYGRKRLFVWGLAGFVLASTLCGLSATAEMLIASRVLQGLCAGLMFPQISSLTQVMFGLEERPKAFGLQGAMVGLGIVAGPLLGGSLIGADLLGTSWRPIFLINVPLGLLILWLALRLLPESRSQTTLAMDWMGVAVSSLGLFLLTYPLVLGRELGWPRWSLWMLGAGGLVLAIFIVQQAGLTRRGGSALLDLSLFSQPSFRIGVLIGFVFQTGVLSFFVSMALFLQNGLGYSAIGSALALLPFQLSIAVSSLNSARVSGWLKSRTLNLGAGLLLVSMGLIIFIVRQAGTGLNGFELFPALVLGGLGFGLIVAPLQNLVLRQVPPQSAGSASGILATLNQVGSAFGVAVMGIIFLSQLGQQPTTERFVLAIQSSLWYQMIVFGLVFGLSLLLRKPTPATKGIESKRRSAAEP